MDTVDWRTQMPPDSRQKIINKIMETLKKHLPFSLPEGLNELRRIATRFEERIFSDAVNQTDYLRKISMKMLTMEIKSQNAAGPGSTSSITPAKRSFLSSQGYHHMENVNSRLPIPKAEPGEITGDWRMYLPPGSRQRNAHKIRETLTKHVGQEGSFELMSIATSLEEFICRTAIDQVDYVRKISFKMQTMEEGN
ncbi:unnamed protein product [Microthlaspi erraticum]|uniref:Mediator complex subunit 15 KIX domain-containing protein n=1 Tax=Microthlaspi erraticum TaxID=1685480 RepID=A0A6D2ILP3_9BRAS|nr:unnamed protein product [Microthlaspi erraticum]